MMPALIAENSIAIALGVTVLFGLIALVWWMSRRRRHGRTSAEPLPLYSVSLTESDMQPRNRKQHGRRTPPSFSAPVPAAPVTEPAPPPVHVPPPPTAAPAVSSAQPAPSVPQTPPPPREPEVVSFTVPSAPPAAAPRPAAPVSFTPAAPVDPIARPAAAPPSPRPVPAPPSAAAEQRAIVAHGVPGTQIEGHMLRFSVPQEGTLQFLPGRLEILNGLDTGRDIRFVRVPGPDGLEVTFGRSEGPAYRHIQLREATVSRSHARLRLHEGQWHLLNLSATNPVVHNARTLGDGEEQPLTDGDRIEMGEVVFGFRSR